MNRAIALALLLASFCQPALAADPEFRLEIQNHRFVPAELKIPAGQKVKLLILNKDDTPEEFESKPLNREKIIPAGAKVTVFVGPLKPGQYHFFGEFNPATAQGMLIAE